VHWHRSMNSRYEAPARLLGIVAASILLRFALEPVAGDSLPLLTCYAAAAIAVFLLPLPFAIAAAALSYLSVLFLFISPSSELAFLRSENSLGYYAYCIALFLAHYLKSRNRVLPVNPSSLNIDSETVGLIFRDADNKIVGVNPKASELFQCSDAEVCRLLNVPSQAPYANSAGSSVKAVQQQPLIESRYRRKDGSYARLLTGAVRLPQSGSRVDVIFDVTAETLAADRLRESEARFRSIVNSVDGIVWECLIEAQGFRFVFVSERAEKILGYPVSRWLEEPDFWGSHLHPEDRESALSFCVAATNRKQDHEFEYRMIAADGREVWLRDIVTVIIDNEKPVKLVGVMVDITAEKSAQRALRETEEKLRLATQAGKVGFWDWDPATDTVQWTDSLYGIHGLTRDGLNLSMRKISALVHPDDRESVTRSFNAAVEKAGHYELTYRAIKPGGEVIWLFANATVYRKAGVPVRVLGATVDITDLKRAEEALIRSKEQLILHSEVLRSMAEGVVLTTHDGIIVYTNPASDRMFGYGPGEQIGKHATIHNSLPPEANQTFVKNVIAALDANGFWEGEFQNVRKDGSHFVSHGRISTLVLPTGKHWVCVQQDVTDRKRSELALSGQKEVLEMLARGANISDILSALCNIIEQQSSENLYATIQLVDKSANRLRAGGRVKMPKAYVDAIDGLSIAPGAASCGTAAFRRERVIVNNIAIDPLWKDHRSIALSYGFRACWSTPILDQASEVLGTFAIYYDEPREPSPHDFRLVDLLAGTASIAIKHKQAEAALWASEARFRALVEQAPFSIQVFAPDGHTLSVNRAWEELWGFARDQVAEYNVLEDKQLAAAGVLPVLQRAFAGESVVVPAIKYNPEETVSEPSRHADPIKYVSAIAYPLKTHEGIVREVVLIHQDITRQKRAEAALKESEEKLRLLANTIPQLVWMARPDGHIFWYNRKWYEYTGTLPAEMEGWGWQSVHDPDVLPTVLERWKASISSGKPFEMVFPLRGADQKFRPFLTRVNPFRDDKGNVLYWFGTNTDVSEIKRMEDALREADRRKDEFLATLAHELRNPLAPLRNAVHILKLPQLDIPTLQKTREMMERQLSQLVRLVDDLLNVSRVMTGKIELHREAVELATVLGRAIETVQPALTASGHRLELTLKAEPLLVDGDPVRLAQVFSNLLNNSVKYTLSNGDIRVIAEKQGKHAVIRISDNGVGIAPEMLERIFDLFVQIKNNTTGTQEGLGIGLTLVKRLVELHGGTVEALSEGPGTGAEFIVRLPIAPAKDTSPNEPEVEGHNASVLRHRLLVVDDNVDAAESLATLLRAEGHDVHLAHDGASALEAAQRISPGLVFLDLGMPGMDGYEVARQMRAVPKLQNVVIAALTGWGQQSDRLRTSEAGFDYHFVKPIDPEMLHDFLNKVPGIRAPQWNTSET